MRPFLTLILITVVAPVIQAADEHSTSIDDQVDIAITAYNNGLALVRDTRELQLSNGELHLTFMDVAQQIRPETVSLRSLAEPGSVLILEQNYEYDLMNPAKLMEKYVGKNVRLLNFHKQLGFEEVTAKLLSTNGGTIYEVDGEIFLGHPGTVVLPEVPDELIAKPSLIWTIDNGRADQKLEATYLTGGISWKADYVLTLAKDDRSLDIDAWVTMNNQSGTTYEDAKLKLVAGDVNQVSNQMVGRGVGGMRFEAEMDMISAVEEAFAEYHLYTIPRRTTIKQNQSKQLALLNAANVTSRKKYEYRGQLHYYSQKMPPMLEEHVSVFIEFENEKENNMGMPLPGGIMRIYQEDSEGMLQFAGEDRILHTPKDETVVLRMGKAFDIIGERVQMDFDVLSGNTYESEFEVTIRNHKESDIVVDIVEPMPADWRIITTNQNYSKPDAHTAVFSVPVKKDGETIVRYRVRVRY